MLCIYPSTQILTIYTLERAISFLFSFLYPYIHLHFYFLETVLQQVQDRNGSEEMKVWEWPKEVMALMLDEFQ